MIGEIKKKAKRENEVKFKMILRQYVNLYRRFVWTTVNECHELYKIDEQHTLQEWLTILSDESRYTSMQTSLMCRRCERLSGNLIDIQKYIEEFQNQSATLILNGFPEIEEILDFFRMQHVHAWGSLYRLKDGDYKGFCDTSYILYKEFLEKFPQYESEFPEKYGRSLLYEWKM